MKKHRKKIIITAIVLLLVTAILFVYFAFFHVPKEERIHRQLMTAHTASNTALLESDKFFDKPDFMIYEIGGERIECTPEETDAIYAEFEKLVANMYAMKHIRGCEYKLEKMVPAYKNNGAVRFCYNQRRKYTGEYPHETPVYSPMTEEEKLLGKEPSEFELTAYNWEDFTFDEVLIHSDFICDFILGENGAYKFVRHAYSDSHVGIDSYFYKEGYTADKFDLAVKSILRIDERFPDLVVNERDPFHGDDLK